MDWVIQDREGFAAQYARARDAGLDTLADEVFEIADDGTNDYVEKETKKGKEIVFDGEHVQRSRLRFDARRWYLSKLAPKKYGERVATEISGPDGGPIATKSEGNIAAEIASVLALAKQRKDTADLA